jgi:hypothetical protein
MRVRPVADAVGIKGLVGKNCLVLKDLKLSFQFEPKIVKSNCQNESNYFFPFLVNFDRSTFCRVLHLSNHDRVERIAGLSE